MRSETEDRIERELVRLVERNGGLCLRWSYPGPSSEPDCIVLLPGGRVLFVMIRRPTAAPMEARQKLWEKTLIEFGFRCYFIWSRRDLDYFRLAELME